MSVCESVLVGNKDSTWVQTEITYRRRALARSILFLSALISVRRNHFLLNFRAGVCKQRAKEHYIRSVEAPFVSARIDMVVWKMH